MASSRIALVCTVAFAAICGAIAVQQQPPLHMPLHRISHIHEPPTGEALRMLGRRPKRAASSFPLGAGGGAYYTNMTLGFQTFPLFVDTGSSLCAVPSMECVACTTNEECVAHKGGACPGQVHYAPSKSTTHHSISCPPASSTGISCSSTSTLSCGGITAPSCGCSSASGEPRASVLQCYADGTGWEGRLVEDEWHVAGMSPKVFFVEKMLNIKDGESTTPYTGIVGLAYGSLSGVPPLFTRLVEQYGVPDVFEMCLGPTGGSLKLGTGGDEHGVVYTPITQKSYYVVEMKDFLVNGTSVGVPSSVYNDGQCIVDSGTTLLAMPHSAYTAFYSALHTMCENGRSLTGVCGQTYSGGLFGGYSFVMSKEEIEAFPSVTVVLSGVTLMIPPRLYLTTDNTGYTSLGMSDNGNDTSGTILGDTVMRGFQVVFDRRNDRVGFGPASHCRSYDE